ncbi:MAG TPA: alpha/beta fold hydrolase [Candidatus Acidoferrales bacterium]|nr:alpha/beta fold hydrolase [Candidatus Acidoferrales bacterium]
MLSARDAVTTYGDPAAPAIVFLHGIRLGREIWAQHATALAHRYYVVALDLPGHGALAGMPFTTENVTALLDRVVDGIAFGPPLIVGYSLGGYVAMRFGAHFPQRTAGLLLAGCTLDFEGWKWLPYGLAVRFTELLPDAWAARLMHASLYLSLPRPWLELVERIPFDRDVFSRTSDIVRSSKNALEEISAYRKPVLFVNGEYDFAFRVDERRFLHRLPQARLRILRGVDHTGPLRRAGEFAAIVNEFAGRVFGA